MLIEVTQVEKLRTCKRNCYINVTHGDAASLVWDKLVCFDKS